MLEREFGSAAVKVPVVGQGTWNMKRDGLEALRTGIELGMTHIDTAELYTGAEEIIAEAIRGIRSKILGKAIFLFQAANRARRSKRLPIGTERRRVRSR